MPVNVQPDVDMTSSALWRLNIMITYIKILERFYKMWKLFPEDWWRFSAIPQKSLSSKTSSVFVESEQRRPQRPAEDRGEDSLLHLIQMCWV